MIFLIKLTVDFTLSSYFHSGCIKMVKILSSASFFLKKEKTEIKSRQNGIIEL